MIKILQELKKKHYSINYIQLYFTRIEKKKKKLYTCVKNTYQMFLISNIYLC